jgi:hypothetical protein
MTRLALSKLTASSREATVRAVKKRAWLIVPLLLCAAVASTSSVAADSHAGQVLVPSQDSAACNGYYFETLAGDVVSCVDTGGVTELGAYYSSAQDGTTVFSGGMPVTLIHPDGSRVTVDSSPYDFDPAISPDGSKIAFARYVSSDGNKGSNLYTVNPDGSGLTLVASGNGELLSKPSFAPNGATIAYSCSTADTSGGYYHSFNGCGPLPDGSLGAAGLMLVHPNGSGRRMIVLGAADLGGAFTSTSWSPDGLTITAGGQAPCSKCSGAAGGVNTQVFRYSTSGSDLFNVDAPSLQVTHETDDWGALFPQFTPDNHIMYLKVVDDNDVGGNYSYLVTPVGAGRHQVLLNSPHPGCDADCWAWGIVVPSVTTGGPAATVNAMRIVAPQLRGLTLAAAAKRLAAVGLRVGTVTKKYSSSIPKYHVLSQYPRAGTVVKRGSQTRPPVSVVMSRGPAG